LILRDAEPAAISHFILHANPSAVTTFMYPFREWMNAEKRRPATYHRYDSELMLIVAKPPGSNPICR